MISNLVTQPKTYSSSPGSYKGITINPGTDADIAKQMRDIDSKAANPATTPVSSTNTKASQGVSNTQPQSVRGLIPDPSSTLSYDRLVGALASASQPSTQQTALNDRLVAASQPTGTQTGLIKDLRNTAQGNFGIGQEAQRISQLYSPEIARIGGLGAGAVAGHGSSGTNVVGSGNAAIASQSASQRMSALSAAQEAALRGTAQQLTAQEQAAGAFGSALGGANTQQAQQLSGLGTALGSANTQQAQAISGLGTAAGLAQPQVAQYGQTVFDPLTGQFVGAGAVGDPVQSIPSLVQAILSGQMSPSRAEQSLNNPALVNALRQQVLQQNPNFNFEQAEATAQAQGQTLQQAVQMGGQLEKQAQTVKSHMATLLTAYNELGTQFGAPLLNAGINEIKRQFGSGPLQAYDLALSNVRDELAKVLGGGTSTEGSRATARTVLPDNMSPAQIQSAIKVAQELMDEKIAEYRRPIDIPTYSAGGTQEGSSLFDW